MKHCLQWSKAAAMFSFQNPEDDSDEGLYCTYPPLFTYVYVPCVLVVQVYLHICRLRCSKQTRLPLFKTTVEPQVIALSGKSFVLLLLGVPLLRILVI